MASQLAPVSLASYLEARMSQNSVFFVDDGVTLSSLTAEFQERLAGNPNKSSTKP